MVVKPLPKLPLDASNTFNASSTDWRTASLTPSPKYSLGTAIRRPLTSPVKAAAKFGTSTSAEVESCASRPEIASNNNALSVYITRNWSDLVKRRCKCN